MALCRFTNAVLITRLTRDRPNAASTAATVPKTTREVIVVTRPFSRTFPTEAWFNSAGTTLYGALGRPGLPVRGGVIVRP